MCLNHIWFNLDIQLYPIFLLNIPWNIPIIMVSHSSAQVHIVHISTLVCSPSEPSQDNLRQRRAGARLQLHRRCGPDHCARAAKSAGTQWDLQRGGGCALQCHLVVWAVWAVWAVGFVWKCAEKIVWNHISLSEWIVFGNEWVHCHPLSNGVTLVGPKSIEIDQPFDEFIGTSCGEAGRF